MSALVEELKELGGLFEQAEQTPYHEAGHAVVMAWLKLPSVDLTVQEDEEGETAGQVSLLPETYRRDYTDSAIGCAAGQAADNLHEEFRGSSTSDWDNSNDNNQIRFSECWQSASPPTISGDGSTTCEDTRSRSCAFRTFGQPWKNSREDRPIWGVSVKFLHRKR